MKNQARLWIKEKHLYPLISLLLVYLIAVRLPLDTDMWWHLRAGEETIAAGEVYAQDTFSFTREGEAWINHSWLSQILMSQIFQAGGTAGLSVWVALSALLMMALVYLQMEGHPLLRSACLLLTAVVSSVVWSPRPQIITLILFALVAWMIRRYQVTGNRLLLYALLLILPLWGNLHGGYALGFLLLGAFLLGTAADQLLFCEDTNQLGWVDILAAAGISVAGYVLVLINPFGLAAWKIPFATVGVETLQNVIGEWASPDFHQAFQQPMLGLLLLLLVSLGVNARSQKMSDLLPVALFTWLALTARRNFGPFAIVAGPLLSRQLSELGSDWLTRAKIRVPWIQRVTQNIKRGNTDLNPILKNLINLLLVGLLITAGVIKTIQVNSVDLREDAYDDVFPVQAGQWLDEHGNTGRIYNDYNWGGYLIYHHREIPVFVDGRTDLFGDEILEDYLLVLQADTGWEEILRAYNVKMLLIPPETALARTAELTGWTVRYQDQTAMILEEPDH